VLDSSWVTYILFWWVGYG